MLIGRKFVKIALIFIFHFLHANKTNVVLHNRSCFEIPGHHLFGEEIKTTSEWESLRLCYNLYIDNTLRGSGPTQSGFFHLSLVHLWCCSTQHFQLIWIKPIKFITSQGRWSWTSICVSICLSGTRDKFSWTSSAYDKMNQFFLPILAISVLGINFMTKID